eukprot:TRINITY_DN4860_c0_g1_i1.p1 TRINITY_DN4860_c0_g1~~TRINITY_DN4860_c0_g1_i1.p1  ORF type:complete len:453 (+),score=133.34 TRINITY_DN4860_c0_g1_i1:1083-2441(+)
MQKKIISKQTNEIETKKESLSVKLSQVDMELSSMEQSVHKIANHITQIEIWCGDIAHQAENIHSESQYLEGEITHQEESVMNINRLSSQKDKIATRISEIRKKQYTDKQKVKANDQEIEMLHNSIPELEEKKKFSVEIQDFEMAQSVKEEIESVNRKISTIAKQTDIIEQEIIEGSEQLVHLSNKLDTFDDDLKTTEKDFAQKRIEKLQNDLMKLMSSEITSKFEQDMLKGEAASLFSEMKYISLKYDLSFSVNEETVTTFMEMSNDYSIPEIEMTENIQNQSSIFSDMGTNESNLMFSEMEQDEVIYNEDIQSQSSLFSDLDTNESNMISEIEQNAPDISDNTTDSSGIQNRSSFFSDMDTNEMEQVDTPEASLFEDLETEGLMEESSLFSDMMMDEDELSNPEKQDTKSLSTQRETVFTAEDIDSMFGEDDDKFFGVEHTSSLFGDLETE